MPRRNRNAGRPASAGGLIVGMMLFATGAMPLEAQQPQDPIRLELDSLRTRIDSLEAVVLRLRQAGEEEQADDALTELRAAAAEAARAGGQVATPEGEETQFQGRQRSLQALNPEISVNVDLLGHLNTDDIDADNFVAREFEFSFQSSLDPFSRAKVFATHHATGPELVPFDGGHEPGGEGEAHIEEGGGFEIEEGYLEWVGLPGSISLKLGKFFQRFGALNRWHAHALPFQSRSLPHLAFLGGGSLAQSGASATWLAPFGGLSAYEVTVEVTRSSNQLLFGESAAPSALAHLNAFWELGSATDLDLGLSWIGGEFEDEEGTLDRSLFGVELAFTWSPPERARYRELQLRGGAMLLDGVAEHAGGRGAEGEEGHGRNALGLWSLAELRLSPQWLVGGRADWVENPAHPRATAWMVSPTLTWWQSEWVRLRLEYDLVGRSFEADDEGRLWFWVTFAMGPHRHETY